MAEFTAMRNNALPYPVYGLPYVVTFPLLDADGDPVSPSSPDSEISKNGDTFADCTNEATEIATSSGSCYLSLTGTELTTDVATVQVKSTGAKTTVLTLYPRKLVSIRSGTSASGGVSTSTIVLDASASAIDDFYNGMIVAAVIDGTTEVRMITDYTGSTQTATVTPDWNTAPDNNDTFTVYRPDGVQIQQANTTHLNSTAQTARDIGASVLLSNGTGTGQLKLASGYVAITLADVASPTTTVNFSGMTIKTATDVEAVTQDIQSKIGIPSDLGNGATLADNMITIEGQTDDIGAAGAGLTAIISLVQPLFNGTVKASGTIGSVGNNNTHVHLVGLTDGANELVDLLLVVKDVSENEFHSRWITAWDASQVATVSLLPFTPQDNTDTYVLLDIRKDERTADIAAVKAKTDNLPVDPADESILEGLITTVDTVVNAIKAKTDNLPTDPADQSLLTASIDAVGADVSTVISNTVPLYGALIAAENVIGATGNDTTHLHLDGLTYADDAIVDMLLIIKDVSTGLVYGRWIDDWVLSTELATVSLLPFTPEPSVDYFELLTIRRDVTIDASLLPINFDLMQIDPYTGAVDANLVSGDLTGILDNDALEAIAQAVADHATFQTMSQDVSYITLPIVAGTVNDTSATTTEIDLSAGFSSNDDFYNGSVLVFISGALKGIARRIVDYAGSGKTATVAPALPQAPSNGVSVMILGKID